MLILGVNFIFQFEVHLIFILIKLALTGGDREYTVLRTFLICLSHDLIGKIYNWKFLYDQSIISRVQEKYEFQDC